MSTALRIMALAYTGGASIAGLAFASWTLSVILAALAILCAALTQRYGH